MTYEYTRTIASDRAITMFPGISDKSKMATLLIVLVRVKRVITRHSVDLLRVVFHLIILKHYFSSTDATHET
jgi:hypothetical protein